MSLAAEDLNGFVEARRGVSPGECTKCTFLKIFDVACLSVLLYGNISVHSTVRQYVCPFYCMAVRRVVSTKR